MEIFCVEVIDNLKFFLGLLLYSFKNFVKDMHYLYNQNKGLLMMFLKVKILKLTLWVLWWVKVHSEKTVTHGVLMRRNKEKNYIWSGEVEHLSKRR